MNQDQLVKQQGGGYQNVYPLTYIQSIVDAESNEKLSDILVKYNHLYLNWQGSQENTRLSIPILIRKHGLWISYDMNGTLYTEWFKGSNITSPIDNVWKDSTNWERIPDLKFVEDASQRIPTGAILPEMLSPALQQLLSKQHVINNCPDDEDLESKCNVLRFKDRAYNPNIGSGKGYKVLRKNWVKGRNVLTQDMINQPNTIYEIRYDYDLRGVTINIPEGCTLKFNGGSLFDGTIVLKNTIIDSSKYYIFKNINISGIVTYNEAYPEWFGAEINNISIDNSIAINKTLQYFKNVKLSIGSYYISNKIQINKPGIYFLGSSRDSTKIICNTNFIGESVLYTTGVGSPAYRSHQMIKNMQITTVTPTTFLQEVNGIQIFKNANWFIDSIKVTGFKNALYLEDTLLYHVDNSYFNKNDVAIYFKSRRELSADNNVSYNHNVMTDNNVVIDVGVGIQGRHIGCNIIFNGNEIEYNGHSRLPNDDRPLIYIESCLGGIPVASFINNWVENNPVSTTFQLELCDRNIVNFNNNTILEHANTTNHFIKATGKVGTQPNGFVSSGLDSTVNVTSTTNGSIYNQPSIKIIGLTRLYILGYNNTVNVENLESSIIILGNGMESNFRFNKSAKLYFRSAASILDSYIYSRSNGLFLYSENMFDIESKSYWGNSKATLYDKPFRIGNLWLWQKGRNLYMKYGATAPSNETDGNVIGYGYLNKGSSDERPTPIFSDSGFQYYDTTLKKYICWDGVKWINLDGTQLI